MKLIILLFLSFAQLSIAQSSVNEDGFGEIRIGKTYEELETRFIQIDVHELAQYAWFAPMSLQEWITETEQDTAAYYEMLDVDNQIAESMNMKIVWCRFTKKKEKNLLGIPVECAQLIFEKNALIGITLAFEKDGVTQEVKESIFEQLEEQFGVAKDEDSEINPPRKFDSTWKLNGHLIRVSDALTSDGGIGDTVHILYWKL